MSTGKGKGQCEAWVVLVGMGWKDGKLNFARMDGVQISYVKRPTSYAGKGMQHGLCLCGVRGCSHGCSSLVVCQREADFKEKEELVDIVQGGNI
jgi:hypothetical protein